MTKIPMKNAVAELDGDEMTRVLWQLVKDKLLSPYVDLKTEYYDLSLTKRDETDDKITYDAAEAIKRLGVGVKCATITSNAARMEEYKLSHLTPSPNGIIRAELDGTVFRTPIFVNNINRPFRVGKNRLRSAGTHTATYTKIVKSARPEREKPNSCLRERTAKRSAKRSWT